MASEVELLDDPPGFSGPPAIPMTRAPLILAIWPAMLPTAPAAPETTAMSRPLNRPTSSSPK